MKITQAVLPVAGLGTRFLPWTKVVPKELLPIGNKPIIALLVDECINSGIDDICFVISRGKESISAYFESHPELEAQLDEKGKGHHLSELAKYDQVRFHTVYQDEQKGDGHAILQANDWVDSDTIAVLFGDDLFIKADTALQQLIKAYALLEEEERGSMLALENIAREMTHKYGIVDVHSQHDAEPRLRKVAGLVEKPHPDDAPSTLGIVGRYLIPRDIFDALPEVGAGHGGEIRLIDALIHKLEHVPVHGYECEGKRLDTGTPEGYKDAVNEMG